MNVLICTEPGEFRYMDMELPSAIPGHAIVKVARIGVCGTDLHAFEGTQPYFTYPRVLGHELSGVIEAVGSGQGLHKGDKVCLIPYFHCGTCAACKKGLTNCCQSIRVFGVHIDGGMKPYISVPVENLIVEPDLSFEELALVEPLAIGAHAIRRSGLQQGEFALVIGAGPIGIGVMEFARRAGARVIAADVNEERLNYCRNEVGVEFTVNPTNQDMKLYLEEITESAMPDVIFDASGNRKAINGAFPFMGHGGRFVLVGLQKDEILFSHPEFHKREATLMSSRNATREDFETVLSFLKEKKFNVNSYITHRARFEEVGGCFGDWLNPANGVIKAMIEM